MFVKRSIESVGPVGSNEGAELSGVLPVRSEVYRIIFSGLHSSRFLLCRAALYVPPKSNLSRPELMRGLLQSPPPLRTFVGPHESEPRVGFSFPLRGRGPVCFR